MDIYLNSSRLLNHNLQEFSFLFLFHKKPVLTDRCDILSNLFEDASYSFHFLLFAEQYLFSVNSSVLQVLPPFFSCYWYPSNMVILHVCFLRSEEGFSQTSPSAGSTVSLSGLSEGGVVIEQAGPQRTPTTGK